MQDSVNWHYINDFVETLNHLGQIDAIFLDMSKAFDTVPLKRLSCELSHYGIRGYTLKWIEDLLTGRSQLTSSCKWRI